MSLVRRILSGPSCLRSGPILAMPSISPAPRPLRRPIASSQRLSITVTWRLVATSVSVGDIIAPSASEPADGLGPGALDPVVKLWHLLVNNPPKGVPPLEKWVSWLADDGKAVAALDLPQGHSWISKALRPLES